MDGHLTYNVSLRALAPREVGHCGFILIGKNGIDCRGEDWVFGGIQGDSETCGRQHLPSKNKMYINIVVGCWKHIY